MRIFIDDREIAAREGASVLDAALEAGVYIPHLCKHPDLEALGGCRLCVVEDESGEVVPSCMTAAKDGMRVRVSSPKADKARKLSMEIILATHPADCTGCPKYGKCELQSMYQYMGVGPERWRKKSRVSPNDDSNPLISHLFTRCVRCGRCIRACHEKRGVKVLDYVRTKEGIHAGVPGGKSLKEAGCKFCGACVEVCPTGSIMDAAGLIKEGVSYADNVVPCRAACPANADVPRYVRYIKAGEYDKAAAVIREKLPFPKTLGRICNHVCEASCKRGEINEPVSICKLKRAAADNADNGLWKSNSVHLPPTGKKAAVIGAGPAGLTAAYYLAKKGHDVTVFEKNAKAGGQCRYGIPAYRLPDDVLDEEIGEILGAGVKLQTNTEALPADLQKQGYDAVLAATGTHRGVVLPLEGRTLPGVLVNTDFLKRASMGEKIELGRVVVLGGGNVAFDCARTALRLGAESVHVACLEASGQMTADKEEIEEGLVEGVILHNSSSFARILGAERVEGMELQKIESFHFDENGRAVLVPIEGSNEIIPADNVIFAVGQKPDAADKMGLALVRGAYIEVSGDNKTSVPGVFAAGDAVTGTKSVVEAIAQGRRSAEAIDRYLGGDGDIAEQLLEREAPDPYLGHDPGFAGLERHAPELLNTARRSSCFDEVEGAFSGSTAAGEASRCLQCDLRLDITRPKLWNEYERQVQAQ